MLRCAPPRGSGITASTKPSLDRSLLVSFNASVVDNYVLNNVSLFFDNVLNTTNSSGVNGFYDFGVSFAFVNQNVSWLFEACDTSSNCVNSSSRNLSIYTIPSPFNCSVFDVGEDFVKFTWD